MFPKREKLNLDGRWIVILDPDRIGNERKWFNSPPINRGSVVLIPQTEPIGGEQINYPIWYIREFNLDESWNGSGALLHFSYINYRSSFWLNGKEVGDHIGAFTTSSFQVSQYLRSGCNLLVIKVSPLTIIDKEIKELYFDLNWGSYPGIWGSIFLEKTPRCYMKNITIRPDIRGKRVVAFVQSTSKYSNYSANIVNFGEKVKTSKNKIVLPFNEFEPWTPDNPKLYELNIEYQTNDSIDIAQIKFGMRDFSEKANQFILNFQPIFVKGVEFEWNLHELNSTKFNKLTLLDSISQLKQAGFNLVFTFGKPLPVQFLELCDELGILVAEGLSLRFYKESSICNEIYDSELEELLIGHRNHPSLVWLLFEDASENANLPNFAKKIRKYDRSRLIHIIQRGKRGLYQAYHCVPYNIELIPSSITAIFPQIPISSQFENFLETFGASHLNFVLDISSSLCSTPEKKRHLESINEKQYLKRLEDQFHEKDLSLSFGSLENLLHQMQGLYAANLRNHLLCLRNNLHVTGYCMYSFQKMGPFSFNDLSRLAEIGETNIKKLSQFHDDPMLHLSLHKTNLIQEEETPISLTLIGDINRLMKGFTGSEEENSSPTLNVSLQIISPTQQVLWRKKKKLKLKKNISPKLESDISGSNNLGTHILNAQAMLNDTLIAEMSRNFFVTTKPNIKPLPIEVIDPTQCYKETLKDWISAPVPIPKVYIMAPITNTIFAYPENDLFNMLAQVHQGAIGLVFSPPEDWNALQEILPDCPTATSLNLLEDTDIIPIHYVKPHPFFINLPTRCVMRQPYRNIVSTKAFLEKSDEDVSGCFLIHRLCVHEPRCASNVLISRYGVGKIVFTHFRILENVNTDPVAKHILLNMLNYLVSRSIPATTIPSIHQKALEWIRSRRFSNYRKWVVVGEFPLGTNEKDIIESLPNLDKFHECKYEATRCKLYYTSKEKGHILDFHEALNLNIHPYNLEQDNGIAYAYAEFNNDEKEEVILQTTTNNPIKIWLNNQLIFENPKNFTLPKTFETEILLKQWKNTIFIQCIKEKGTQSFAIDFLDKKKKPIQLSWFNNF